MKRLATRPHSESGSSFLEVLIGLSVLGTAAIVLLSGLATESRVSIISDEQTTAEGLARSQLEYVKTVAYQPDATQYPVSPDLTVPQNWTVLPALVALVHQTDDGLQKVTVTVQRDGRTILNISGFKANRE